MQAHQPAAKWAAAFPDGDGRPMSFAQSLNAESSYVGVSRFRRSIRWGAYLGRDNVLEVCLFNLAVIEVVVTCMRWWTIIASSMPSGRQSQMSLGARSGYHLPNKHASMGIQHNHELLDFTWSLRAWSRSPWELIFCGWSLSDPSHPGTSRQFSYLDGMRDESRINLYAAWSKGLDECMLPVKRRA